MNINTQFKIKLLTFNKKMQLLDPSSNPEKKKKLIEMGKLMTRKLEEGECEKEEKSKRESLLLSNMEDLIQKMTPKCLFQSSIKSIKQKESESLQEKGESLTY